MVIDCMRARIMSLLHGAACEENIQKLNNHLDKVIDINNRSNEMGYNALHLAALANRIEVAEFLISKGADVSARSNVDVTPLHIAIKEGFLDFARMLLDHGADPNIQEDFGRTALDYAEIFEQPEMEGVLREHGAELNNPESLIGCIDCLRELHN